MACARLGGTIRRQLQEATLARAIIFAKRGERETRRHIEAGLSQVRAIGNDRRERPFDSIRNSQILFFTEAFPSNREMA
jgi:hypothetical protein